MSQKPDEVERDDQGEGAVWPMGRRSFLGLCGAAVAGTAGAAVALADPDREAGGADREWSMGIDIDKCIGCGRCVDACRRENEVPEGAYRTWIERYIIFKDGRIRVDSPDGGEFGFPDDVDPNDVRKSFHVPKLCNHCVHSACTQVCPVGATFGSPDGVTLVDRSYCVGCSYCVQACPYGCRFINEELQVADKCTFCYHRITKGEMPACVEVCPTQARIFGDLLELGGDEATADYPAFVHFMNTHNVQVLKPHLGTRPKVFYNNLDSEVG